MLVYVDALNKRNIKMLRKKNQLLSRENDKLKEMLLKRQADSQKQTAALEIDKFSVILSKTANEVK